MNCMNLIAPLNPFRKHNGIKRRAHLTKVPLGRGQQCVPTGSKKIGRMAGGPTLLSAEILNKKYGCRVEDRGAAEDTAEHACFSSRLLLGYCTLSSSIMGCSSLCRSLRTMAPPWAPLALLATSPIRLLPFSPFFVCFYFSEQVDSCCGGMHPDTETFLPPVALSLCSLKEKCGMRTCRAFL